ncbi:MAG TPA: nucleotidyltransferase family protein [Jiangellaceae bacterium]
MNPNATNSVLRSAAAHGLPGVQPVAPQEPLDLDSWEALLRAAQWERVVPLLAQAVIDGTFPATNDQLAELLDAELQSMGSVLALEAKLVEIADVLDDEEIPFRVLKGPALAHLDYPEPALREFGDIDLLIAPNAFDRAVNVLTGLGYCRRFPEPREGFDRRFSKSVSMVGPDRDELDLHRTLASGGFGQRIIVGMLWSAQPAWFTVANHRFAALGIEERFLNACYHMVLGNAPPRLVPQRDLAQMLLGGNVAHDRVQSLAAAWQGEAVVAHAVTTTWRNLHLTERVPLSAWAAEFRPRHRERRELARATSPHYTYAAQAFDSIRAIRNPRDQFAYVSALAFPRSSYLQGRHAGFAARVRYAVSEVMNSRLVTKENR